MLRVAAGTRNPGKLQSIRDAFSRSGIPAEIVATPVPSGVGDQPQSAAETLRGALQRAQAARREANSDLGIGIEGGLFQVDDQWFECGWVHISANLNGQVFESSAPTAGFAVPHRLLPHLEKGLDLNQATEEVLGIKDIGEGAGLTGYLTGSRLTRSDLYTHGVILALAPLHAPELW